MNIKFKPFFVVMVAVVLVTGVFALSGCATPEKATDEAMEEVAEDTAVAAAEEEAEVEMVEYLFVQHAEGVTLESGVLTLKGVGDEILYFSDRTIGS